MSLDEIHAGEDHRDQQVSKRDMPDALAPSIARTAPEDHGPHRRYVGHRCNEARRAVGKTHALNNLRQPYRHPIHAAAVAEPCKAKCPYARISQRSPNPAVLYDGLRNETGNDDALLRVIQPGG